MGNTDRVDVLCAARLEGPGLTRWSRARLVATAIRRAGKCEVSATLQEPSYRGRGLSWTFTSETESEHEAVALVRTFAERPEDIFEQGTVTGGAAMRQPARELFDGLELKSLLDTTKGATELSGTAVTVGAGRWLASRVEAGEALTADLAAGIERYFSSAPFTFGYWAPYKRLVKLLEARAESLDLLAVALARIDGQLLRVTNAHASDDLRSYVPPPPLGVAGPDTVAYLMRRGRRLIRRLGRTDHAAYVRCASAFLKAADAQGAHADIAQRWILADILYGRGASEESHGRGSLHLPEAPARHVRRWDRFPKAWNEHLKEVRRIWVAVARNSDVQTWAFNVLRSQRQELPALRIAGLRLALLSPSAKLRAHACDEIASKPKRFLDLDPPSAQAFLEFSSAKQFAGVYPTIESGADVKTVQDAVLAYIGEHGLPEVLRGGMPSPISKRSAKLLCFSLRFLGSRFEAADAYHLARYVGETTKFKPVTQWKDTFAALPLKTLVELRLHLRKLPTSVVRAIDRACREAVAKGSNDESLAAALTLSPAPELHALGWELLANASDATISSVWTHLIAQARSKAGMDRLRQSLGVSERIERLVRHPSAPSLLSDLVFTLADAEPKLAESLFWHLSATGDSPRSLSLLERLISSLPEGAWPTRASVLRKLTSTEQAATRLIWEAVDRGELPNLARLHVATRPLAAALVAVVDPDELLKVSQAQIDLLLRALQAAPSRLHQELPFAVASATCPHPSLQQFAIARLEARRELGAIFLPLAESGMPAAVAASERYVTSRDERDGLTKAVIALCDSGVATARSIGLRLLEKHADQVDLPKVLTALTEHTSPDVIAEVAQQVLAGAVIRRDALKRFDNRVLRTRRVGRKAKELVKARLASPVLAGAVSIGASNRPDDQRTQALIDMARGSSLRDRDWALQQLARLALDGHPVRQAHVSTTS